MSSPLDVNVHEPAQVSVLGDLLPKVLVAVEHRLEQPDGRAVDSNLLLVVGDDARLTGIFTVTAIRRRSRRPPRSGRVDDASKPSSVGSISCISNSSRLPRASSAPRR